jgi:hypothetical protein
MGGEAQREESFRFNDPVDEHFVAYNITQMLVQAGSAIAASTFLQAVVQHSRRRHSCRRARLLRRQQRESGGGLLSAGIQLRTEQGWRISLESDVPAEALVQLSDLCNADPPHSEIATFLIHYGRGGWEGWGGVDGEFAVYRWQPEEKRWIPNKPSQLVSLR